MVLSGSRSAARAVTDEQVHAVRSGDESAFVSLWRTLNPPLLRYAQVMAPEVAEDVAADAWVAVIAGLHRFSGGADELRAWLFVSARRRALDHHRRRSRRPTVSLEHGPDLPGGPEPELLCLETFGTAEAISLLRQLPPEVAEVLALRVIAGMDAGEVAAIIGRPAGTIRVMTHRGLRRLERILGAVAVDT
jgi:RNA polymerase sigma-70 factor (ECF subfamily)